MAKPQVDPTSMTANKNGNQWNYFHLSGSNFVATGNNKTKMKDFKDLVHPTIVWNTAQVHTVLSSTLLLCRVKVPNNHPLTFKDGKRGSETIDVTVTNPDEPDPDSMPAHVDVDIIDELTT